ncbi:MAG: hypothetical protein WAK12_07755 [Acidimicrobiales bacterium]
MRRLVALFVLALVGAVLYGLSGSSSGIMVNHESVKSSDFLAELSAISHHDTLQCYIDVLDPTSYANGAGGASIEAKGAATWANLRVEGLAIDQYVTEQLKYHPDAAQLAAAKTSLESEMTEEATEHSATCPGTSAEALAQMPAEMRTAEIQAQATSLYLVSRVKSAIPLTASSMKSYYEAHVASYDTLCVSVAVVPLANVSAFEESASSGLSVAALAKKYSEDPSAAKGGAYGCFAPSSEYYDDVRSDVVSLALDTFSTSPSEINFDGSEAALFVAVTKRTVTPFAKAESAVLNDLRSLNASSVSAVKNDLLYRAAVHVDPAFGQWGVSSSGPSVLVPLKPAKSDVNETKPLTAASATYK